MSDRSSGGVAPRPPARVAEDPLAPANARLSPGDANNALIDALARTIESVLEPLVPADRPVALLDFPHVPNVGDSVIWLGASAFLKRRGIRPCYTCSNRTYSQSDLARRIGSGTILLSGGGNFGDLYPPHQELREAVVGAFPRNRILQLPQTLHFRSGEALASASRVFNQHPDVTLLVRDASSLAIAREHFRATSVLCPDMAFVLGPQLRSRNPSHPVVWLARVDREAPATFSVRPPAGVLRVDWLRDDRTALLKLSLRLGRLLAHRPRLRPLLQGPLSRTYGPLARERMRRGSLVLSSGRVVVTNRLHAHILCLLLGIPHIVLDNSYGKVRGFYEAWTQPSPLAEWGASESEALARAGALAASGGA